LKLYHGNGTAKNYFAAVQKAQSDLTNVQLKAGAEFVAQGATVPGRVSILFGQYGSVQNSIAEARAELNNEYIYAKEEWNTTITTHGKKADSLLDRLNKILTEKLYYESKKDKADAAVKAIEKYDLTSAEFVAMVDTYVSALDEGYKIWMERVRDADIAFYTKALAIVKKHYGR